MSEKAEGGLDRRSFIKTIGIGSLAAILGLVIAPRETQAFGTCSRPCLASCQVAYGRCCTFHCNLLTNCDDICPGCADQQFACMQLCCARCHEPCPEEVVR